MTSASFLKKAPYLSVNFSSSSCNKKINLDIKYPIVQIVLWQVLFPFTYYSYIVKFKHITDTRFPDVCDCKGCRSSVLLGILVFPELPMYSDMKMTRRALCEPAFPLLAVDPSLDQLLLIFVWVRNKAHHSHLHKKLILQHFKKNFKSILNTYWRKKIKSSHKVLTSTLEHCLKFDFSFFEYISLYWICRRMWHYAVDGGLRNFSKLFQWRKTKTCFWAVIVF